MVFVEQPLAKPVGLLYIQQQRTKRVEPFRGPRDVPQTRLEHKEIHIIAAIDIPPLQPFHQFYKGLNRQPETQPTLFHTHITCSKASWTYGREIYPT